MKKLIILIVFLITTISNAQQFYEGEAKVTYKDEAITVITFDRSGKYPTSFVISTPNDEPKIIEGRIYQFYLEEDAEESIEENVDGTSPKKIKKITVLKHDYSCKQLNIDRKGVIDSINLGSINTKFIRL